MSKKKTVNCLTCGKELSFKVRDDGLMSIPYCPKCKAGVCPDCGGKIDFEYVNGSALRIPDAVRCLNCGLRREIYIV